VYLLSRHRRELGALGSGLGPVAVSDGLGPVAASDGLVLVLGLV
jgi:hypothetical protein